MPSTVSLMSNNPVCSCERTTRKTFGGEIYPHRSDLNHLIMYICDDCKSYVGCHPGTDKPLGTPANSRLRTLRSKAHACFDPIWRQSKVKHKARAKAYKWLAYAMKLPSAKCHIALFDEGQCLEVIEICTKYRMQNHIPNVMKRSREHSAGRLV